MTHLIPKILHVSWKTTDIFESDSRIIKNGLRRFHEMNPEWGIHIHTDEDVNEYLSSRLKEEHWNLLKNEHIVAKLDVWRLMILHETGGMYMDLDRYCDQNMDEIIQPTTKVVLPMYQDTDFSQDIIISVPENPFLMAAFIANMNQREAGISDVFTLGPVNYMSTTSYLLTGKPLERDPSSEDIEQLRHRIEDNPNLQTYREEPPGNTFIYRSKDVSWDQWEKDKRELYASYDMKHWTGEW